MSLYKTFTTDKDLEKEGILLQYGFNSKKLPITIRVARAGGANTAYTKSLERRTKPFRRQIQTETMDDKQAKELMMDVYLDSVILGWENMEDAKLNDLPFSRENALKLFTDLPDLFTDVQEQAQKSALYRKEILDADSKN